MIKVHFNIANIIYIVCHIYCFIVMYRNIYNM